MESKGQVISAGEALKFFKVRPSVQTAVRAYEQRGDGKAPREKYQVESVPCRPEHVMAAKRCADRVVIVTIDGQRHESRDIS